MPKNAIFFIYALPINVFCLILFIVNYLFILFVTFGPLYIGTSIENIELKPKEKAFFQWVRNLCLFVFDFDIWWV